MFFTKALKLIFAGSLSTGLLAGPAGAASEVVLHSFQGSPNDGAGPAGSLIKVDGEFYGTTGAGGAHNYGTVFKITRAGVVTVLHSFGSDKDGISPSGGLLEVDGVLYGTTSQGGTGRCKSFGALIGCGTVFKITQDGVETVLYSFKGGSDGAAPYASLVDVGGVLYGTTFQGGGSMGRCGAIGCGTVFKITTAGAETVLHSFGSGSDGINPQAGLIEVDGVLYGTTTQGGTGDCSDIDYEAGCGTVFKITPEGVETVLLSFQGGIDGAIPQAGLTHVRGALYGTTNQSGGFCYNNPHVGCGTVFKITREGVETPLHAFKAGSDGAYPTAGLVYGRGVLFGTTSSGGTSNVGTVFSVTTSGAEEVLHSFKGEPSDGASPSGLIHLFSGALYGLTITGGSFNAGTVFRLWP